MFSASSSDKIFIAEEAEQPSYLSSSVVMIDIVVLSCFRASVANVTQPLIALPELQVGLWREPISFLQIGVPLFLGDGQLRVAFVFVFVFIFWVRGRIFP